MIDHQTTQPVTYRSAGVNIQSGHEAIKRIKSSVEKTFSPAVLNRLGGFGALYDLSDIIKHYREPVLVQSMDGVGTKAIIARMMNSFSTLGHDLVSANVNDIVVLGAKPLTFLDYVANDKLNPDIIEVLLKGMSEACQECGVSLIGGEMAEMPGTYLPGEHDLVGCILGVAEKSKIISGHTIQPGDSVLGLESSGLHTNGYSLARKIFFDVGKYKVDTYLSELQCSIGEALLRPHLNYTNPIQAVLKKDIEIKGMAHITGGGFLDNIPRILPHNCDVELYLSQLPQNPLFSVLCNIGNLDEQEKYRVFNMGIGLVLIVSEHVRDAIFDSLKNFKNMICHDIGRVIKGSQKVHLK